MTARGVRGGERDGRAADVRGDGGAIGLAVTTSIFWGYVASDGDCLTLDDGDGAQLDAFLGDAGVVTRVDDFGDVLVRFGRLLHDEFRRSDANRDALGLELGEHVFVL